MTDHRSGRVNTSPACNAGAQSEFGVIGICKKVFVESSDQVQHGTAVHSRAAIGPEHFFHLIILAGVEFAAPSAAVLAVGINEMTGFVDTSRFLEDENFGSSHAHLGSSCKDTAQRLKPGRFRFRVIIQECDEFAIGRGETLIVGGAESSIAVISN